MGNSASKASRKFPTRPPGQPTPHGALPKAVNRPVIEDTKPVADSHRSQVIEKDGADPQFLSNLSELGQVRVDHLPESIRSKIRPEASTIANLFESRAKADLSSSAQSRKNIMNSTALTELLDRRKSVKTRAELERLSKEFGIEMAKLGNLARFVNSPSVDKSTIRPAAGKSEEEGFVATVNVNSLVPANKHSTISPTQAVWMEPNATK